MNGMMQQAIEKFTEHMGLTYPQSSTEEHYENDLQQFVRVVDKVPHEVSRQDVTRFVTQQLTEKLSPATVNRRLASLHHFFEYLANEAEASEWVNPVVWSLHRVKQGVHLPRDLSERVARQFWGAVQTGPVRDQTMVGLMLDVGLRVNEVVRLGVKDYEAGERAGAMASLRVQGKGGKERRVWLAEETAGLLAESLRERGEGTSDALFVTRRGAGFTVRGLQERVKHYTVASGLPVADVSCHRLRHTFARRMAEAHMPLPSLSHWLGHSQLKTTQLYIDGANLEMRADYEAAMQALSRRAECPVSAVVPNEPAAVAEPQPVEPAPVVPALLRSTPLTSAAMQASLSALPVWLQTLLVALLCYQQPRWKAQHQRERALQWLAELRRAWIWLESQQPIESLATLRRSALNAYLLYLQEKKLSTHTINHFLTTFWVFLRFAEEQGATVSPALYRIERPPLPDWQPKPFSEVDFRQLEATALTATQESTHPQARLDRAWFLLLCDSGLRISELLALTVADYDSHSQTLLVRQAKYRHDRRLPLSQRVCLALDTYLTARTPSPTAQQPLFTCAQTPLSTSYLRSHLHHFAQLAGVQDETPHRLRHTFATRLLNSGKMSVHTLQKLMGHRHIDTTMRYAALYPLTIQHDYQAAMQTLQARPLPEPDEALWGPVLDQALAPPATVSVFA